MANALATPDAVTVGVSPTLVGLLRGAVYAAVVAVVAGVQTLTEADLGGYAWALPFLALAARAAEGRLDKALGAKAQATTVGGVPAGLDPTVGHGGDASVELEPLGIGDALAATPVDDEPAPAPPSGPPPLNVFLTVTPLTARTELRDAIRAAAPRLGDATVAAVADRLVDLLGDRDAAVDITRRSGAVVPMFGSGGAGGAVYGGSGGAVTPSP